MFLHKWDAPPADPPFPAYLDKGQWIVKFQIYSSPRDMPYAFTLHCTLELNLEQRHATYSTWVDADSSM